MAIQNMPGQGYKAISGKGRIMLSIALLLGALVLGMGLGAGLFHAFADAIQRSEFLGALLCGEDMRVGRLWVGESSRIACFDAAGRPLFDRGSALGLLFGLPFFLLFAVPALWFAWRSRLRGRVMRD